MNSKVSPPLFQDILTVDHDGCPLLLEVNRHFYRIVPHRGVESHGHDDDDLRGIRVPMEIELYLGRFQPQLEISVVVPVVGKSQSSAEIGVIDHSQVLKNGGLVPIGHYSHSTGVGLNGGLGKVEKEHTLKVSPVFSIVRDCNSVWANCQICCRPSFPVAAEASTTNIRSTHAVLELHLNRPFSRRLERVLLAVWFVGSLIRLGDAHLPRCLLINQTNLF